MIKIVEGNILDATEDIIAHQVNCQKVMGSGLAKQIRNKYPYAYDAYNKYCERVKDKKDLLGEVCLAVSDYNDKTIAHLFGQFYYGRDKQYTDYEALKKSLTKLLYWATIYNNSIALPCNLGSGLAGGDWNIVYKIIEDVFQDYDVTIYKLV